MDVTQPPNEAPQLRQLGIGDIIDRVFALYRSRPLVFFALAAPPYLVLTLVFIAIGATHIETLNQVSSDVLAERPLSPAVAADFFSTVVTLTIVGGLAAILLLSVQIASLVDAVSARYLGRRVDLGTSFVNGLRAAPRLIAAAFVLFVLFCVLWVVVFIVMAVSNSVLVVLVMAIAGTVATFYIAASSLVMPVVATVEGVGPIGALRRSFWLAGGNRWRIIGVQLLLFILNVVVSSLLSAVLVGTFVTDPVLRGSLQTIVNAIATIAWAPVEWGAFTILYYDLRVRHEAFDLQLAAEALPREP
ncbi:MAG TPA: hypothetical protein VI814_00380 [Candidatus Limnocylindria bacterium]